MKWTIEYSRSSDEFIAREDISLVVGEQIGSFLKKMRGESINIDVKKLNCPSSGSGGLVAIGIQVPEFL